MKLKLDMVYRDLPAEEAQVRFAEVSLAPDMPALEPIGQAKAKKPARRKVKALVTA